jgi:hypothetical protein
MMGSGRVLCLCVRGTAAECRVVKVVSTKVADHDRSHAAGRRRLEGLQATGRGGSGAQRRTSAVCGGKECGSWRAPAKSDSGGAVSRRSRTGLIAKASGRRRCRRKLSAVLRL